MHPLRKISIETKLKNLGIIRLKYLKIRKNLNKEINKFSKEDINIILKNKEIAIPQKDLI